MPSCMWCTFWPGKCIVPADMPASTTAEPKKMVCVPLCPEARLTELQNKVSGITVAVPYMLAFAFAVLLLACSLHKLIGHDEEALEKIKADGLRKYCFSQRTLV